MVSCLSNQLRSLLLLTCRSRTHYTALDLPRGLLMMESKASSALLDLPTELLGLVLGYLPPSALGRLCCTAKHLQSVVDPFLFNQVNLHGIAQYRAFERALDARIWRPALVRKISYRKGDEVGTPDILRDMKEFNKVLELLTLPLPNLKSFSLEDNSIRILSGSLRRDLGSSMDRIPGNATLTSLPKRKCAPRALWTLH